MADSCRIGSDGDSSARGRIAKRIVLLGLLICCEIAVAQEAQDTVVLKSPSGVGQIVLPGEITDYTGKRLRIKTGKSRTETTYPATDVIEVRAALLPEQSEAQKEFDAGNIVSAEAGFQRCLGLEPRLWMKREIHGQLVKCALHRNDIAAAGTRYLAIHATDPETRFIALLPLSWSDDRLDPKLADTATDWFKSDHDVRQLLGASLLLLEPRSTSACETVLHKQVRTASEPIRTLAQWQLWRLRAFRDRSEISENEIKRWMQRVAELPSSLKAGPYFVLATGHAQRQEFDLAAAAFLRVPFSHHSEHPVTARALLEAALSLRRAGQTNEADRLLAELVANYRGSPSAEAAAKLLSTNTTGPSGK